MIFHTFNLELKNQFQTSVLNSLFQFFCCVPLCFVVLLPCAYFLLLSIFIFYVPSKNHSSVQTVAHYFLQYHCMSQ